MAAALPNIWHLRTVAASGAKPCIICYKPATSVLITPDSAAAAPEAKRDFFYTCAAHLKDRGFATAKVDPAEEAAKLKKAELEREIEKVKAEYEEKQKAKRKKKKGWFGKDEDDEGDEKLRDEKIKALENAEPKAEEIPRIYELHKDIYQMRLNKIQAAQLAKRRQEQLRNPNLFPAVPSNNP